MNSKCLAFLATKDNPFIEVYRVENKEGMGPYHSSLVQERYSKGLFGTESKYIWQTYVHNSETGHPGPYKDPGFDEKSLSILENSRGEFLFGFLNKTQFEKWFLPEEVSAMGEMGLVLVKFKATEVWSSEKQIFFKPWEGL